MELKETMTVGSNFNDKTRFEAAYIHARETMQSDTGRTLVEMMKTIAAHKMLQLSNQLM